MKWLNEPGIWQADNQSMQLTVEPATDFWRITHYGFIRHAGHFYFKEAAGDFELSVKVSGKYHEQYHQAGLMVRLDEKVWIKTGIEYVDGLQQVSAVVTSGFSDWSVVPCSNNAEAIRLKLLRKGDYVQIDYSFDGITYTMLRLAPFPPGIAVQAGMMAAAPGNESFTVYFENFQVIALT
jgi:regulation of enolase protein 1 (concanavalin A-like superfamily)